VLLFFLEPEDFQMCALNYCIAFNKIVPTR